MDSIVRILNNLGPCRSSNLAESLQKEEGISDSTARQRIFRSNLVIKFPIQLLPNREKFIYLKKQRQSKDFLLKLHTAMKKTNSVYGMAIDSLSIRGGIVKVSEFSVISGAPVALKKQITTDIVAKNLERAKIIEKFKDNGIDYYSLKPPFELKSIVQCQSLSSAEDILLDGIKDWARKLGLASYDKIQIRGDKLPRKVGQFVWDLTGPSYLLPLKTISSNKPKPGFLVIDVFSKGVLSESNIKYFVRKVQLLQASIKNIKLLPILVGEGFDSSALKYGKGKGMMLVSIEILFGRQVAKGISTLIETLNNSAAIAIKNPKKMSEVLKNLSPMEGAMGNLRGICFELISVYLAKKEAESIDHSVKVTDPQTGKTTTDIDVFRVIHKKKVMCIECKGKGPSGIVSIEEVDKWFKLLPKFKDYVKGQERFKQSKISFELWSTGTFSKDAIKKLEYEKKKRVKNPIDWKNGENILKMARDMGEQSIVQALKEHYLKKS